MATNPTPPTPSPAKTAAEALEYLTSLEAEAVKSAGKPGHNPYIFLSDKVYPIAAVLKDKKAKAEDVAKAISDAFALKIGENTLKVEVNVVTGISVPMSKPGIADPGKTVLKPVTE